MTSDSLKIDPTAIVRPWVQLGEEVAIGEYCVIGRQPSPSRAMVRKLDTSEKTTRIGARSSFSAGIVVYTDVTIGEDCLFGDHSSIFCGVSIGDRVLVSRNVTINSDVSIGDDTRLMDNCHITGRCRIGNSVFFSVGVVSVNDNSFGKGGFSSMVKGATVEDYVSIGPGVVLLPECSIGKGSIVAAGSVVKGAIPHNVIAAGNPARIVCRVPKHLNRC
jgi:acetyltransferase-like isoleucine patch superfamily enzyme